MSEDFIKVRVIADNLDNPHDVKLAKMCEKFLNNIIKQEEMRGMIVESIELALLGGGFGEA